MVSSKQQSWSGWQHSSSSQHHSSRRPAAGNRQEAAGSRQQAAGTIAAAGDINCAHRFDSQRWRALGLKEMPGMQ